MGTHEAAHAPTSPLEYAGYEHPVDEVVADLLACLDDPALPLMQFTEAFAVVQVNLLALSVCICWLWSRYTC